MSVETHIDDAIERVDRESNHFAERLDAVEAFERGVEEIQPETPAAGGPAATDGGVRTVATSATSRVDGSRCKKIRELFAETVYPHSATEGEEPVLATMSEELAEPVSLALAPGTDQQFTPAVKRMILSATAERRSEIESMQRALDAERRSLVDARATVRSVTDWLAEADQTALLELDFEQLQARHAQLAEFLDRGEQLAADRQATIHGTTSQAGAAGVDNHQLVEFLYQSFPVTYPVLSTLANLEDLCEQAQRRVRDHLVRRV